MDNPFQFTIETNFVQVNPVWSPGIISARHTDVQATPAWPYTMWSNSNESLFFQNVFPMIDFIVTKEKELVTKKCKIHKWVPHILRFIKIQPIEGSLSWKISYFFWRYSYCTVNFCGISLVFILLEHINLFSSGNEVFTHSGWQGHSRFTKQ